MLGENADLLYIILQGRVEILKTIIYEDSMDVDKYFQFLLKLKENNDFELLKKTIELNNQTFKVNYAEVKYLPKILKK